MVVGNNNIASGYYAGRDVTGNSNIASGTNAGTVVTGDGNVASGTSAGRDVAGNNNLAFGLNAGRNITANDTVAIGSNATATLNAAVALGSGSVANKTAGSVGFVPMGASAAQDAAIVATRSTLAGVSVGDADNNVFRQIHGVAAGTIDSDAVNVAQLKAVTQYAQDVADTPLTFAGDTGSNVERKLGATVTLLGGETDAAALTDGNIGVVANGADTLAIKLNKDIDLGSEGSLAIGNTSVNNNGLMIVGGPSITNVGINAGGYKITNVAAGTAPTDAMNYGQFMPIESFVGLDGSGSFAYNGEQHKSMKDVLDSMHWTVEAPVSGGSGSGGTGGSGSTGGTGSGSGGSGGSSGSTPIHNSNTVGFVEGDNIVISKTERPSGAGADITVGLAQDITLNSVTAVKVNASTVNANEVRIENGPIINEQGIDMSGNKITNLAEGTAGTDAVNVDQLNKATGNITNNINRLENDIRRNDNRASAGVAAAMAVAGLPQAYLPGKSMFSIAGGTWRGESGYAMGLSTITDNGKWVVKGAVSGSSRGDYGGTVGVGYQW